MFKSIKFHVRVIFFDRESIPLKFIMVFSLQKQELETALSKEKMEKLDLETQLRAKVTSLESQLVSLETAKTHEKSHLEDQIVSTFHVLSSYMYFYLHCNPGL